MNTITKQQFQAYIEGFDFTTLFNQLGWTYLDERFPVKLKEETYTFHAVAEKGGFRILVFEPGKQAVPDYATRLQLDRNMTKLFREHLIIFCDADQTTQIWQLFVKQAGKPSRLSETRWHTGQTPELLYQKTAPLFFTLDEEERITIADVVDRVQANFGKNVEQVTKKFYEHFRKEHRKFLDFITGIAVIADQEWYASLMLNRLMFCYFIQKKGFLDQNPNYLKEKLAACQRKQGNDRFYVSFYKNFLLALFHEGLGSPEHSDALRKEFGNIPYLNGGLFDLHELEKEYADIDIRDEAFTNVFQFFDQYNWHLDTRITASGKDINPDVIGYIFEKYINDRAQMGAYYTKEDITDYIGKNCIIPYLFDETSRHAPNAFKKDAEIWNLLQASGDTYIYDAVKKGVELPLPDEIAVGVDTQQPNLLERRKAWNAPAPDEFALPTEIWREVVDRRNRYREVTSKIEHGEIRQINDLITFNLDIRQFAQDVIDQTTDPEFLRHFYKALTRITILDPTCGSGAFLFAAMNILEPLYQSCLQRMENFVAEAPAGTHKFFEEVLNQIELRVSTSLVSTPLNEQSEKVVEQSRNQQSRNQRSRNEHRQYFIYKSIILRNLHGVDIMQEAVEIAKLRLFLKLVATVEADYRKPNLGLEPLPDIDFNVRAGNTLVGFATEQELTLAFAGTFDFDNDLAKIQEKCDVVARTFRHYKAIQLGTGDDYAAFKQAKDALNTRLRALNHELNLLLHKQSSSMKYDAWLETHEPFHWFAEFYEIVHDRGGFDVIIGNPPYVELKKIDYDLSKYLTQRTGNLYAPIIERYFAFIQKSGRSGMIIPHSSICTDRMEVLIKIFNKVGTWFSSYDIRPSKLFDGVDQRLLIYLTDFNVRDVNTSRYHRWSAEFRPFLFSVIEYVINVKNLIPNSIIKSSKEIERNIINKISNNLTLSRQQQTSLTQIYFHNAPRYFIRVMDKIPYFWNQKDGEKTSTQVKSLCYENKEKTYAVGSVLNSSLFYWWFVLFSDSRHLNNREIDYFPFSIGTNRNDKKLILLFENLNKDFEKNKIRKEAYYKATGEVVYDEYYPKKSKSIIDEIDKVLAEHYGFTEEELDFIINYDIKYRMGKELDSEEEHQP